MARRRRWGSGDLAGLGSLIGVVCVLAVAWIIDVVKANLEVIGAITVVAGVFLARIGSATSSRAASHPLRLSTIFDERPLWSTATGQLNGKSWRNTVR